VGDTQGQSGSNGPSRPTSTRYSARSPTPLRWCAGGDRWMSVRLQAEIDLRVGGECRWVMHPEGRIAVLYGRIVDLDPPQLLVMTLRKDLPCRPTTLPVCTRLLRCVDTPQKA
jgi:uncharacterized protein YndB with AHSA1/START domain